MKEVRITKDDAGQRLDKFLMKSFPDLPKSLLYKAIRNKKIKRNRKRAFIADRLEEGDVLLLFLPDDVLTTRTAQETGSLPAPQVVYEDRQILVINKPAGLLSVPDHAGRRDTAISRIQHYLRQKGEWDPDASLSFSPAIVSRLDRNTQGLILAAKDADSLRRLSGAVQNHDIEKSYTAWVEGDLERDPGEMEFWIRKDENRARASQSFFEGATRASMNVRVIGRKKGKTQVRCDLHTGRFHQIRAGMALLGHPLCGDVKYGAKSDPPYFLQADRLVIHNTGLEADDRQIRL